MEPQRLYRQIGRQLRSLIQAGKFREGSRLPAERHLALSLGISRPSLREALIALEVEGYIEVRKGSGIYVCTPPSAPGADFDLTCEEAPLELIRARRMVEGEVAAAAAKVGRKTHFDAVEDALNRMQADAQAGTKPLASDRLFHLRIAESTGNSVLVGLVGYLFDARLGPLFDRLDRHFETPEVWAWAIEEHRDVLRALRAHNPARARAATRRHMDLSFQRLTSSLTYTHKKESAVGLKRIIRATPPQPAVRSRRFA